jgi:uncharacterized membrane protein (UPF0182 family)
MPELERVIAIYGNRVVMERTLGEALAALFKAQTLPAAAPAATTTPAAAAEGSASAHEALAHYQRAIDDLKSGDWAGFGTELNTVKTLLEQLDQPAQKH